MARARNLPALVAHGGAGNAGPGAERPERRRGMMAAIRLGAGILRAKGSALEAVVATVVALVLAVGWRTRRWRMVWLPVAVVGGIGLCAWAHWYVGSAGLAGDPAPGSL